MPMEVFGIRELNARLQGIGAEMQAELRPAIEEGARLVETKAEADASEFSSDIASHIHSRANFSTSRGGAEIWVEEFGFPHSGKARVFEGNGESPEEFLAPNWGRDDGHVMSTHPYLNLAADEERSRVEALIEAAVVRALTI